MAAPPLDLSTLNRVNAIALAYWTMILVWTFVVTVVWFTRGPEHPLVALFTAICTFALTPGVAVLVRRLPVRWYRVPAGERVLHRILGIATFGRLARAIRMESQQRLPPHLPHQGVASPSA